MSYGRFVLKLAFFTPAFRLDTRCARTSIAVLCLVAVLIISARNVLAQQTMVWGETPETGERVACTVEAASSNAIELNRKGIEIAGRGLEVNRHRHSPTDSGKAMLHFPDNFNRMTSVFSGT